MEVGEISRDESGKKKNQRTEGRILRVDSPLGIRGARVNRVRGMSDQSGKSEANQHGHVTGKPRMRSFQQAGWGIESIHGFALREMGRHWKLLLTFHGIPLAD